MRTSRVTVTWAIGFSLLLPLVVGCAGLSYYKEEAALRSIIHQAYKRASPPDMPKQYLKHFERGWGQAYYNISQGADPCPPSTPPEEYWATKYQNPEGGRKIAAWFEGYRQGVEAAYRDCRHVYSKVPQGPYCERESANRCEPVQGRDTFPHAEVIEEINVDGYLGATLSTTGVELSSYEVAPTIIRLPPVQLESFAD